MFINAYYFRAHMYTLVPDQVRHDMNWMAEHGTKAVTIGVLEQDLFAAVENIQIIQKEAEAVGMQLYVTPSRWGGLIAGCPKVPSIFSATRPDTLVLKPDGQPHYISPHGPVSSVHHPDTLQFFCNSLDRLFEIAPIAGVVWDEIKVLDVFDHSPMAKDKLGNQVHELSAHIQATADFFEQVNAHLKTTQPEVSTHLFIFGHCDPAEMHALAKMNHLDSFGMDGRPWSKQDGGDSDTAGQTIRKSIIDQGPAFIEVAKANGKQSLFLIENHGMPLGNNPLMDQGLPEVLAMQPDHLIYYYYPRSLPDPDANMNIIGKHLKSIL